jgi:hypothetical protein
MISTTCRSRIRAVLLLEVVVALAVMVTAMGFLGAQLVGGIKMTMYAEEQTRASQLADRMLALLELDPNTVERFVAERKADGDFGAQYPEWFWRASAEELKETQDLEEQQRLSRVTVEILHDPGAGRDADIDEARVVRQLHLLKAAPGTIDLEKDFGVPAEQVESIMDAIREYWPGAITETGEIDLRVLMQSTSIEDLFMLMPMFAGLAGQSFGDGSLGPFGGGGFPGLPGGGALPGGLGDLFNMNDIGNLSPDQITALLNAVGGLQLSDEQLRTLLASIGQGGFGPGGGSGPGRPGDRGGGGPDRRPGDRGGAGPGRRPGDRGGGDADDRQPRDIGDLDRDRDARNDKWTGR